MSAHDKIADAAAAAIFGSDFGRAMLRACEALRPLSPEQRRLALILIEAWVRSGSTVVLGNRARPLRRPAAEVRFAEPPPAVVRRRGPGRPRKGGR